VLAANENREVRSRPLGGPHLGADQLCGDGRVSRHRQW